MDLIDRLIAKWEARLSSYTESARKDELRLCLSDIKMSLTGEAGKYPPVNLDSVCHFKKYKGQRWKAVIENDPGYVEWCMNNVLGFQIDEDAHKYLVEIQSV